MIVHSEGLMSLDEYLYARVHIIRQSQILISEKFLFIGSKRAVVSKLEDDSEKWSKSVIKLKNSKKSLRNVKRKVIVSVKKRVLQKFEVPLDVHAA